MVKPKTFSDQFTFIPVRPAHLEFFAFVFREDLPPIDEVIGNTMVDRLHYLPLGFALARLWPSGAVSIHAYFGQWLKQYPKDVLRGLKGTIDELRAMGIKDIHAVADENVEGSVTLVKWFKGEKTAQWVEGQGWYYKINLDRSPI